MDSADTRQKHLSSASVYAQNSHVILLVKHGESDLNPRAQQPAMRIASDSLKFLEALNDANEGLVQCVPAAADRSGK